MSEAGTEVSFSLRKRIVFALGSGSGCAKGEIADLIAAVIEIPLYYPALARTDLPALYRSGIRWRASKALLDPGHLESHCHSSSQGGDVAVWLPSAIAPKHHASPFDTPHDT